MPGIELPDIFSKGAFVTQPQLALWQSSVKQNVTPVASEVNVSPFYSEQSAGDLTRGGYYEILSAAGGADFTAVGAPNNNVGTQFRANNDNLTPTWGSGSLAVAQWAGNTISITGTTDIERISKKFLNFGCVIRFIFGSALTIKGNITASGDYLPVSSTEDIEVVAGDELEFQLRNDNKWHVFNITRAVEGNYSTSNRKSKEEVFILTQYQLQTAYSTGILQLSLLNNIATDSAVWVEVENWDAKVKDFDGGVDYEFTYTEGSNTVEINVNALYFQIEVGWNVTVKYFYDVPLSQEMNRDLELILIDSNVVNGNQIVIDYQIRNNAAFDDVCVIDIYLDTFSGVEQVVIPITAGGVQPRQKIYYNVPPGTYTFYITGDVSGDTTETIAAQAANIVYRDFNVLVDGEKYYPSAIGENLGSASGIAQVYFQLDSDALIPSIQKGLSPSTYFKFTELYENIPAGTHTLRAFEDDQTTLIGDYTFTVVASQPERAYVDRLDCAYYYANTNLPERLVRGLNGVDISMFGFCSGYYYASYQSSFNPARKGRTRVTFDVSAITVAVGCTIVFQTGRTGFNGDVSPFPWEIFESTSEEVLNVVSAYNEFGTTNFFSSVVSVQQGTTPYSITTFTLNAAGVAYLNSVDYAKLLFLCETSQVENQNSTLFSNIDNVAYIEFTY